MPSLNSTNICLKTELSLGNTVFSFSCAFPTWSVGHKRFKHASVKGGILTWFMNTRRKDLSKCTKAKKKIESNHAFFKDNEQNF